MSPNDGTNGNGGDGEDPRGWADRVRFSPTGPGFAYRPGEILTSDAVAARRVFERIGQRVTDGEGEAVGAFTRLRLADGDDVTVALAELREAGVAAQPNHVFFADGGGCGCGCPPHPATPCGPGANPVYASPVYASPVYASPVYASPVYASPVYASPVYASPVYASPVYASPVYASDHQATGVRESSARSVPARVWKAIAERLPEKDGDGIRVAVLDTGVANGACSSAVVTDCTTHTTTDTDEPDRDFPDQRLDPAAGHGTFIAGLVLQVEPTARISCTRVLTGLGDGDEVAIATAIESLAGEVDVLNLSFSGYVLDHPAVLAAAVRLVQRKGAVVVASAGNDGQCRPTYPAALPGVVSVGALGPQGPAPFSNYGPWVRACAPGVDLVSTFFDGFEGLRPPVGGEDPDNFYGFARWSGTSFSAPLVAAAIAHEMTVTGADGAVAVERLIDAPHLGRIPDLGTVVNVPFRTS